MTNLILDDYLYFKFLTLLSIPFLHFLLFKFELT